MCGIRICYGIGICYGSIWTVFRPNCQRCNSSDQFACSRKSLLPVSRIHYCGHYFLIGWFEKSEIVIWVFMVFNDVKKREGGSSSSFWEARKNPDSGSPPWSVMLVLCLLIESGFVTAASEMNSSWLSLLHVAETVCWFLQVAHCIGRDVANNLQLERFVANAKLGASEPRPNGGA